MIFLDKERILEVCLLLVFGVNVLGGGGDQSTRGGGKNKGWINELVDIKEWKHLLKTKTNVLIHFGFHGVPKTNSEEYKIMQEVAEIVRGIGTIALVNCNTKEGKKLCKKVKVRPYDSSDDENGSFVLKHYHNGAFNKDYDRAMKVSSMVNFLKDPTGDLPWEEEIGAGESSVLHLLDPPSLSRLVRKGTKRGIMIMFYAPWCAYCKKMKPDYSAAAEELKDEAILAAIDVNRPENNEIRKHYNITGFPTLLYFRNGKLKHSYDGENTKDGLISFLRNPDVRPVEKPKESDWSEEPSEVVHLTMDTFHSFIKENPSVLVMFYAPWCGHCKRMKPAYISAAEQLKELQVVGRLAAVDCTRIPELAKTYDVSGYPTIKYFRNGVMAFDAGNLREEDKLIDFMLNPQEPPPPPPPEKPWSEDLNSPVVHFTEENFERVLKEKKHALVMFYAPWCGHCKEAKPEFIAAANDLVENVDVLFGAVDCTLEHSLCTSYEVKGYPTFKHFQNFNQVEVKLYNGGRTGRYNVQEIRKKHPSW